MKTYKPNPDDFDKIFDELFLKLLVAYIESHEEAFNFFYKELEKFNCFTNPPEKLDKYLNYIDEKATHLRATFVKAFLDRVEDGFGLSCKAININPTVNEKTEHFPHN